MRRAIRFKPVLYSVVIVGAALDIYWHLYTGGWLTNPYYRLNDPDIVNLVLAIVEPILFLVVVAYWLTASATLHRILFWSFILQLLICAGFGLVILLFVLTWHPRMM
jgi:hypothetical protein